MVYSPIMPSMKLTAQDMGVPDYQKALQDVFKNTQDAYETAYKPKNMAEKLLEAQLKNKHDETINKYLDRSEQARIANTEAGTGLIGQQSKYFGPTAQSEIDLRKAQQGLYGAQAQQAAQEAEWKKRAMEMFRSSQDQQPTQAGYQPGSGMAPYAQNAGSSQQPQQSPMQQFPLWARKALGLPAEFPDEKMNREIYSDNIKGQNKLDMDRAQALRESAKDLSLAGIDINGIHDILTGPDSLSTGVTKSLIGKLGFGSEKLGELNERALRLQAQMTKAISSRGGVGAANIVASGKPSSWKSTSENLGISKAYAERINNEFELLNQEYKNITGKDLPYTLPEYVHNIGKKVDSLTFKPKVKFNNSKEYHAYMSSLKPEQRKIALKAIREASK